MRIAACLLVLCLSSSAFAFGPLIPGDRYWDEDCKCFKTFSGLDYDPDQNNGEGGDPNGTQLPLCSWGCVENPDVPDQGAHPTVPTGPNGESGNGVSYYDNNGDGVADCYCPGVSGGEGCETPACVCELLAEIRDKLSNGGTFNGLTKQQTEEILSLEDSDEDGCPDAVDPDPEDPEVGCSKEYEELDLEQLEEDEEFDRQRYRLAPIGTQFWSQSMNFPMPNGQMADVGISTATASMAGGYGASFEIARQAIRLILGVPIVLFVVQSIITTLRQY